MTEAATGSIAGNLEILGSRAAVFASKRPAVTSGLLGLIAALGYPPVHGWWIALPALALFLAHLHHAPTWRAALLNGWAFGWAHLTLANNWIATAFTYQAKMPELLGWVAVPLLCIYLAVYPALAALIAHLAGRCAGPISFGLMFAAAWIVTEWLRSWVFTGYPWPPLGLMLLGGCETPGIARLLPWLGTYALSGLAIVLASFIVCAFAGSSRPVKASSAWVLGAATVMMFVPAVGSGEEETGIRFRLVQPLIPQEEMNDGSKFEEQFQRTARLTAPGNDTSRLVLWPESSLPDFLEDGYPQRYYNEFTFAADPTIARERIGRLIGPESTLLAGVINFNIGERPAGRPAAVSARNSVIAMNGEGVIGQEYAKAHLVPYGEYLPMEWLLKPLGLDRLTAGGIPYIPGPGPQTLDLGEHGKAGIQICYEIVFSGQVVDRENRPDYLFNPSNDGWFGMWGPPQHFAQARMRALEEGLPVLRSTTTGISGLIDANGVVVRNIAKGEAAAIEGTIPQARAPTLFARFGNALAIVWAAFLAIMALAVPRLLALYGSRG